VLLYFRPTDDGRRQCKIGTDSFSHCLDYSYGHKALELRVVVDWAATASLRFAIWNWDSRNAFSFDRLLNLGSRSLL
jgi:hypothetical protein